MTRRLLIVIALAGLACSAERAPSKEAPVTPASDRSTVEEIAHLRLPPSATNLRVHAQRGIDDAVWARFDVRADEVDRFLTDAGYTELSSSERAVENWHLPTKADWWTPDAITSFRSGRVRREASKPRYAGHLLVASTGVTRTVYLFVTGL